MLDEFTRQVAWRSVRLALALLLCCAALAGCGDSGRQAVKCYDIQSEAEEIFPGRAGRMSVTVRLLGMQYYRGEAVQLWSEGKKLYLRREDGSRELLMEVPGISAMLCFLDGDGNCYSWRRYHDPDEDAPAVRKYDASGREVYSAALPPGTLPAGICQLPDGSIVLLLESRNGNAGMTTGHTARLAKLDPGSGAVSDAVQLASPYVFRHIAAGETGVLVLDNGGLWEGVREVSMSDGAAPPAQVFQGGNYTFSSGEPGRQEMQVQDFRMLEEGGMEVLWADPATGRGVRERLRRVEVDKIPVVIRSSYLTAGDKLRERVLRFNQANDTYYAVLEYPALTRDEQAAYITRTNVEIGTGKGPDVLAGYLLDVLDSASLAEKGALEDLAPYMEKSGLREGDYFPGTFGCLRDGGRIYTATLDPAVTYLWTDASVLGGEDEPDIGELVGALAAWQGGESYSEYPMTSSAILRQFLGGSEDLWGMADWEEGTCDFGGDLFRRMLEAAGRYGEPEDRFFAAHPADIWLEPAEGPVLGGYRSVWGVFDFESDAELRAEGKARSGWLFDDGCHALFRGVRNNDMYAVNANSAVKEGAWEFIRFMLGEEVQRDEDWPVHRAIHMEKVERKVQELVDIGREYGVEGGQYMPKDITEEWLEEYARTMDEARHLPVRTQALVDIICEEAEYYFDGVKSMDEVIKIIENRVGLYIGEHR